MNREIKCDLATQGSLLSNKKEQRTHTYYDTDASQGHHEAEETRLKKLHAGWFHVHDILKSDNWLSGARSEGEG